MVVPTFDRPWTALIHDSSLVRGLRQLTKPPPPNWSYLLLTVLEVFFWKDILLICLPISAGTRLHIWGHKAPLCLSFRFRPHLTQTQYPRFDDSLQMQLKPTNAGCMAAVSSNLHGILDIPWGTTERPCYETPRYGTPTKRYDTPNHP